VLVMRAAGRGGTFYAVGMCVERVRFHGYCAVEIGF
jgi:hypothetical protein